MTVDRRRLTETFFDLVRIDSPTFEEADVIAFISRELASLGIKAQSDSAAEKIGGNSGNLIAHLPGDRNKPAIFINCHVDTVEPGRGIEPRETDGIIAAAGETILGADDKAGAAALLELARVLASRPTEARGHVDLVFSVAEERGLLGVKNLDHTLVTGEYGFVLDAAGRVGDITITAPYQDTIEAVFIGRAAHAGVNPEQGVSAIRAAAAAVNSMSLGRVDDRTTANIGIIEGGRAVNIVPEKTLVKGEARSLDAAGLERQTRAMVAAMREAADDFGATVEVEVVREYDGFDLSKDALIVRWAADALRAIGVEPAFVATGGGSDTNVFNMLGIPTINLGAGYRAPHTVDESISAAELERIACAAVAIVETVARD